ncbi:DsbA family protein [Streptomyces mirabilis]|uniref:DsbA family oxidoreductase n=1 Tax=Streptomyces mirabilis TaxID=68239 RepID=UPI00367DD8C0
MHEVQTDFEEGRRFGATGVPFFVFNRAYGVSGAQSSDTFLSALRTAHADPAPENR